MKADVGEQVGTVYTETVVHAPPAQFAADAPYQVAIVELATSEKITVRIEGNRVQIGDRVVQAAERDGVVYFEKAGSRP